jgi:hypothetical protein
MDRPIEEISAGEAHDSRLRGGDRNPDLATIMGGSQRAQRHQDLGHGNQLWDGVEALSGLALDLGKGR